MKVLLLNQAFWPDVVSSAQHGADLARELAADGHEVTVLTGRRAYGRPEIKYPSAAKWNGVKIIRVGVLDLGKGSRWRRAVNFASFLVGCATRLFALPRQDVVLAMTSPPLISVLGALFTALRGGELHLWVMDLNPDQAVAAGWLREKSLLGRTLQGLLGYSLRSARKIIALDRFMQKRIEAKGVPREKIVVIPPWSHDDSLRYDPAGQQRFRSAHGLDGKFVVMYSGNHSPCHPLDTLLSAAAHLAERQDIVFCFIGGGSEFERVQRYKAGRELPNIMCLPYQPIEELSASLSAADLHVVVMGDPYVGIVHPCKIYNILSLGIPFLYIGPTSSHITDFLPPEASGDWAQIAAHGEVRAVTDHIVNAAALGRRRCASEEELGLAFSRQILCEQLINCCCDRQMKEELWNTPRKSLSRAQEDSSATIW